MPESRHANFSIFLRLKYLLNHRYFHQHTKLELMTKFGRKRSTFTLPKTTFLKYPENTEKWPFCLSPDMQNLSSFLMSQILAKPSLFHQNTKLELMTKWGRKRSTFTLPKTTFLKYLENTEKWPFCLSPDMPNLSNFLMSQILTKPSVFQSDYQIRVPDQIWPKNVHF